MVAVWDGGGNVMPAVGLTAALVGHGHDVRVIGPEVLQARFERVGARYRPLQRAKAPYTKEVDFYDDNPLGWARYLSGRRLADEVLDELRSEPTDVAIVDAFMSAGFAAAEKAGVPAATLMHVLYAPVIEAPLAAQWDSTRPLLDATRQRLDLPELDPAVPLMADLWSRSSVVLACAPQSFDFPSSRLPANARYVGPILDQLPAAARQPGAGRILVSFSTTAMRQRDVLQRTLDALADLDVEVVCTLGGVPIDDLKAPPNASIADWIPHRELLPCTDLVITHAGLSTVMSTLASGVPMVCLPMGRDQPLNAQRVAALGLGIERSAAASADAIREAAEDVLKDEQFMQRAASMAGDIAAYGNGAVAVQELESLL